MTLEEKIDALSEEVSRLRAALIGVATSQPISLDSKGNPVVVTGYTSQPIPGCDGNPYKHHYRMPSGLCCCQDLSWAR